MLKEDFLHCLTPYTKEGDQYWNEIDAAYHDPGRHYHTLHHLDHVLKELKPHQSKFEHWATIVFAIAYHDIIYSVIKNDNEEQSATLAVKRMRSLGFESSQTERCRQLILATKKHEAGDGDTNLFIDADLSILGALHQDYVRYAGQVRKEYDIYPDLIYKPGRKKVILHFLSMPRIYKTDSFYDRYEAAARNNLQWELNQ
jgi:predicted metal-dependent HD superfamily phosphohydrolase